MGIGLSALNVADAIMVAATAKAGFSNAPADASLISGLCYYALVIPLFDQI
jgi:hypothetical protein